MQPGDRHVCAFVDPVQVGHKFSKWLLHVTIVPWFRLPDSNEAVAEGLNEALKLIASFRAQVGEKARFGKKKRRVNLIKEPVTFTEIELKVRDYFHHKKAWLVDETTKRQRQFRPHITFQDDKHLNSGDEITVESIYIVEQKGQHKEVVAQITLS